jgi:protease I
MSIVLLVVPPKEFNDIEFFEVKEQLIHSDHEITIASTHEGNCVSSRGDIIEAELSLHEIQIQDYDGVVFIGGHGSMIYFYDRIALQILIDARSLRRMVGALCFATVILANSGVLDGIRATTDVSKIDEIEDQGAIFTGDPVTIDDGIITANGPNSSKEFGKTISLYLMNQEQLAG